MTELVVGVDGGGSKTVAVAIDGSGRETGRAVAGSSNYTAVGGATAAAQVLRAVTDAVRQAGGTLPVRAVWAGLAGIDRPGARDEIRPLLIPLANEIRLSNDAELNFGALPRGEGVVLIAGTGSIAFGRNGAGATSRAGGWGHIFGDEGSGYDLGRRALRAAAQAADGRGPATTLLPRILAAWELDQPMAMIGRAHGAADKAEIAALAGVVFAAAKDRDAAARTIIRQAATELAKTAIAAAEPLKLDVVPMALAGGLLTGEAGYRARVLRAIRRLGSIGEVVIVSDPALSAARTLL
jgi:N-acetylglucosamine kinase-like BadF-type ATPase